MRLRIQPRFCLILIGCMLLIFSVSFLLSGRDLRAGAARLEAAQAECAAMEAELEALRDQLAYTETDDYVVRVARDELGMVMPGEIRYIRGN